MEPLRRVAIGVNAGIIGGEFLHLIEAVFDRIRLRFIAQMPLAGKVSRIAVFLKELGDRRCLLAQRILIAGRDYDRER